MTHAKRRAPGAGSIVLIRGRWVARVYLQSGHRVSRQRQTYEQAERALAELIQERKDELGYWTFTRHFGDHAFWAWPHNTARRPTMTRRTRFAVFERDSFRCVYCGSTDELVVDHVQPVADGGSEAMDNLATACKACNDGKADRPLLVLPPALVR